MEENEKALLEQLDGDLKKFSGPLEETIEDIVEQGFSKYPILIAHKDELSIADIVLNRFEYESNFHFSASTIEVMVSKGVIRSDMESELKKHLDSKKGQVCVLLVHPTVMKIIFSPLRKK